MKVDDSDLPPPLPQDDGAGVGTGHGSANPGRFAYLTLFAAPLVIWIGAISWGSLTTPDNLPEFDLSWADKLEHAGVYAILGFLLLRAWVPRRPAMRADALAMAGLAAAWGLYLEVLQRLTGYRSFDLLDAVANGLGAISGIGLWLAWSRRRRGAAKALKPQAD